MSTVPPLETATGWGRRVSRRSWLAASLALIGPWPQLATGTARAADESPAAGSAQPAAPRLPRWNDQDLTDWRIVDQFVFRRHGQVAVSEGVVKLGKGNPGTAIAWTGPEPPRNNYQITLEARRLEGDDFFCGLTFPVDKSHCTLILGGWGGSVTGLSNVDDFPAVENETTGAIEVRPKHWHRIRLRVTPAEIQAWFDDAKILDLGARGKRFSIWWEQEPVRPLGIATWNTAAELRSFKFARL